MSLTDMDEMLLVDVDEETWDDHLDQVEDYLGNVLIAQSVYADLLDDTADKVDSPYLVAELEEMHDAVLTHEEAVRELFEVIGREPPDGGGGMLAGGTSMLRQEMADVLAFSGGVAQPWDDLVIVWLTNFQATGAVATAMQLGTALGYEEFSNMALPIMQEQFEQQRLLQEVILETAPLAILYEQSL